MASAQRGGCLACVGRYLLVPPGAHQPQIGDGEADRRERSGAGLADAERRRQYRIGAAGDLDLAGPFVAPAGDRQDRTQSVVGHGVNAFSVGCAGASSSYAFMLYASTA